jgi:hypothetical protein
MSDEEVSLDEITETLRLIKTRYKQLDLAELGKVQRYVNNAWHQLWPSYEAGGHKNLAEREALQLVVDLQMELKTELDARKAAANA